MADHHFVERVWYGDDAGARLVRGLLYPAERAYAAVIGARDLLYDAGWLHAEVPAIPAISVGNLSVGGTGKTPFAAWVARGLAARGARPAIVLRGYGGDEPLVHRTLNPDIPVVADPNRVAAIAQAAGQGATVAVLDDAFQHRHARRDIDLVLISADAWTTNTRLLPAGPWRESLRALRRATVIVVTRRAATDATVDEVHAALSVAARTIPRVSIRFDLNELVRVGGTETAPIASLAQADVRALVGIADPRSFLRQLLTVGARVVPSVYPDHHAFRADEVARFVATLSPSSWAVCTLKDAVKLGPLWPRQGPSLWYVSQRLTVERGVGGLEHVLDGLVRARSSLTPATG